MSTDSKLEFLWNNAKTLNSDSQTQRLLKSYYINVCRKLARNLQIPKEKFSSSQMCTYCGCFWNDVEFGLKLVTKQLKNNSKTKKLIDCLKQNDCPMQKRLTKSQKNRAKWLKKKISNHLAINCFQCKHTSLLNMENQKYKHQKLLTQKSECKTEASMLSSKIVKKQKSSNSKLVQGVNTNQPTSISRKAQKERISKNIANIGTSSKVVSKTQKQNSLLQLASLLQKQSKDTKLNSAQNRLQSFLK